MPAPFVSVVIPVLNDRDRLNLCLRALEKQSYPRDAFEVVVVDNGSDRPVGDVALSAVRVAVLSEPQPGSYAARNTGIRQAKGEMVAFTDSDCIPHEDWLRRGVEHLRAHAATDDPCGQESTRTSHQRLSVAELYRPCVTFFGRTCMRGSSRASPRQPISSSPPACFAASDCSMPRS